MTRLYAELAGGVVLVVALTAAAWWFVAHERGIGEQKVKDADAATVAAQVIHNVEVETRAATLAQTQVDALKAKLAAPVAVDAPHLVCVSNAAPRRGAVPKDAGPGPSTDAALEQPAVVPTTVDFGATIDKRFQDDDALIAALQQRIDDERGVCR